MWIKYGEIEKGFCVGFDFDKLFQVVGGGGKITYKKNLPPIYFGYDNNETQIIKTIYYKEEKWKIENEYRLHKMWKMTEKANRCINLPEGTIIEVILGKNMDNISRLELKTLMSSKHPKAKIIE